MLRTGLSAFLILHGFVHLLYFGHARGYFELAQDLEWPTNSWFFSRFLQRRRLNLLASGMMILCTASFFAAGLARFFSTDWWMATAIVAVVISSASYLLLWDGSAKRLPDQGMVALFLNILVVIFAAMIIR